MPGTDLEMKLLKTLPFAAEKMSVAQRLPNLLVCQLGLQITVSTCCPGGLLPVAASLPRYASVVQFFGYTSLWQVLDFPG